MTDHDPLCYMYGPVEFPCPQCALIAKVRADERERGKAIALGMVEQAVRDERERIARAIEEAHKTAPDCGPCSYGHSARIAREGR